MEGSPMSQPVLIAIYLYPGPVPQKDLVAALLDAFEASTALVPSHWGHGERERLEYAREQVIENPGNPPYFFLHRKTAIKYTGYCELDTFPFVNFQVDKSTPSKKWSEIALLADRLAAAVKPRFGLLHIFWPAQVPWVSERDRLQRWLTFVAQPVPVRFRAAGPMGLGMRTYFGSDILEMFGREKLLSTPGVATELDWGGIRVDLAGDVGSLDQSTTLDLWLKAMEHLKPTGALAPPVFDDDHLTVDFEPSPAWAARKK
jgi:hypothetical protein